MRKSIAIAMVLALSSGHVLAQSAPEMPAPPTPAPSEAPPTPPAPDAPKPEAPPKSEAKGESEDADGKDKPKRRERLKATFKPRAMRTLPKLVTEEEAVKLAEKAAADLATRAALSETGAKQVAAVMHEYGKRKYRELAAAHANQPKRVQDCLRELANLAPRLKGKTVPEDWVSLMLEAARLRPEQLMPRKKNADRENAFTALCELTEAEADDVRVSVGTIRTELAKSGDPWTVADRMTAIDRDAGDALKLVLTPDDYFRVLEARGVIKKAEYEVLATRHFREALVPLALDDETTTKVHAILDDEKLINELKYERIARLLGEEKEKPLGEALKAANRALEKERKDAAAKAKKKNDGGKKGGDEKKPAPEKQPEPAKPPTPEPGKQVAK